MYNNIAINIITIIIGLCIGFIFGYIIFKKYTYKGPNSNEIIKQIQIDSNGKKYKWIPEICICPIYLSMGKFADPNYKDPNH